MLGIQKTEVDIAIVGAGPAGAMMAYLLARAGWRTVMLDRLPDQPPDKIGESLPLAAERLLRQKGLGHLIDLGPHQSILGTVSAWGDAPYYVDAFSSPDGGGWRLDRLRFEADLRRAALAAGSQLLPCRIHNPRRTKEGWYIPVDDGALVARWLIDATGRTARIARSVGAIRQLGEPLVAVWGVGWPPEGASRNIANRTLIEWRGADTDAPGWWYGAPLPDGRVLAALHTAPERARLLLDDPAQWRAALKRSVVLSEHFPLSAFDRSPLRANDASGGMLEPASGPGWLAIGDAAVSFDPIASQGLFNALATASMAADSVMTEDEEEARKRYDHHVMQITTRYHQSRQGLYGRVA